jgi:hypothetical protein
MLSRLCALVLGPVLTACVVFAAGCKQHEQDSRPLPPPEPPASAATGLSQDEATAAPRKRPVDDEPAAKPKRPATDAAPPAEARAADGSGDVPATTAAPAASAAPVASVPALPSAGCLSGCQAAMQSCLSAPVDGGVPGFGNLDVCKKAFEACQSACAKQ